MGKNTLIFASSVTGHHLEYIHHLYHGYIGMSDNKYVFCLPFEFTDKRNILNWEDASNIKYYFFDKKVLESKHYLLRSLRITRLLNKAMKETGSDNLFAISLMELLPLFALLNYNKKIKVSGIIYMIYLYRWNYASIFTKMLDILKHFILTRFRIFEYIYMLNSEIAPRILNKKFKTTKYFYLPDPFFDIGLSSERIGEFNFSSRKTFLHIGTMSPRKGTLEILDAIILLQNELRKNSRFVFAGRIDKTITQEFMEKLERIENSSDFIEIHDYFCDFEAFNHHISSCDFILIPYKLIAQSSGIISYSAKYEKPIIGPQKGMIGNLIRKYKLGVCIEKVEAHAISSALLEIQCFDSSVMKCDSYMMEHSVDQFQRVVNIL